MNDVSSITVVSGLPRSGTSLLMQMLRAGGVPILSDQVRAEDANNPRGYLEFEPVKRLARDASWIPQARGKAVKVIAQLIGKLPPDERYHIIMMRRDVDEVITSQMQMLERLGTPSTSSVPPAQLARIFARQWQEAVDEINRRPEMNLLIIDHRAAIENPAAVVAELTDFLPHHELESSAMAACVDPTLYRARKPA